jgi:cytoskeleton protein RodZ
MEEKNTKIEELAAEPKQGSGSLLAAARKQQNKTIEEIAMELNLSVSQIKTIELDQTEGLPEPTYVRGYIRSYAKLLGLAPEEVLHNYLNPDWQKTSSLNDIPRGIGNAENNSPGFFTFGRLAGLLILALLVSFLWYSGVLDSFLNSSKTSTIEGEAQTSVPVENSSANADSSPDAVQAGPLDETTADVGDESIAYAEPVANEENELLMNFSETSWVDIRDGDDTRLAYKSFAQGEELRVSSADTMRVFIGNAEGVNVTLNGQEYDLADHREGVYARFEVPKPVLKEE